MTDLLATYRDVTLGGFDWVRVVTGLKVATHDHPDMDLAELVTEVSEQVTANRTRRLGKVIHLTFHDDVTLKWKCRRCPSEWWASLTAGAGILARVSAEMEAHECYREASILQRHGTFAILLHVNGQPALEVVP